VVVLPHQRSAAVVVPAFPLRTRWNAATSLPQVHWRGALKSRTLAVIGLLRRPAATPETGRELKVLTGARRLEGRPLRVIVGTVPGARKYVAEIVEPQMGKRTFVKLGLSPGAQVRIRHEETVLRALPPRCGPRLLGLQAGGGGIFLVSERLEGEPATLIMPPRRSVFEFVQARVTGSPIPLRDHPSLRELPESLRRTAEPLMADEGMLVPLGVQHGDFTPWNTCVRSDEGLGCFDWEYGVVQGLPVLDVPYWLLQTSNIAYRHAAEVAVEHARAWLTGEGWPVTTDRDAYALVGLALAQALARDDLALGAGGSHQRDWRLRALRFTLSRHGRV
jgi:hypothetical protein